MTNPALPICPQCQQTDQVQKVSSLYELNTKEWIETHHYTDADGEMRYTDEKHQAHTLLGLKLKPPEKPGAPRHPGIWYGLGVLGILFLLSLLLSFLCPFAFFPVLFVGAVFTEPSFEFPDIAGMPAWMLLAVVGLCLLLFVVVAVVVALVWVSVLIKRRYDRALAGYREKKTRYERADLPRWERAMRRWKDLYFCLRDETVFLLGEEKIIRLEDLQKYLLDPYYQR